MSTASSKPRISEYQPRPRTASVKSQKTQARRVNSRQSLSRSASVGSALRVDKNINWRNMLSRKKCVDNDEGAFISFWQGKHSGAQRASRKYKDGSPKKGRSAAELSRTRIDCSRSSGGGNVYNSMCIASPPVQAASSNPKKSLDKSVMELRVSSVRMKEDKSNGSASPKKVLSKSGQVLGG